MISHVYCAYLNLKTFVFMHLRHGVCFNHEDLFVQKLICCLPPWLWSYISSVYGYGSCYGWLWGSIHSKRGSMDYVNTWSLTIFYIFSQPWLSKVYANSWPRILEGVEIFCIVILWCSIPFEYVNKWSNENFVWVVVFNGGGLMWCTSLYVDIIWALCEDS